MEFTKRIEDKLTKAFCPTLLELVDESAAHAGHAGAKEGGETHFNLTLVSDKFEGVNRVARHRLINKALSEEFSERLHALTIKAYSPTEWQS